MLTGTKKLTCQWWQSHKIFFGNDDSHTKKALLAMISLLGNVDRLSKRALDNEASNTKSLLGNEDSHTKSLLGNGDSHTKKLTCQWWQSHKIFLGNDYSHTKKLSRQWWQALKKVHLAMMIATHSFTSLLGNDDSFTKNFLAMMTATQKGYLAMKTATQ